MMHPGLARLHRNGALASHPLTQRGQGRPPIMVELMRVPSCSAAS